MQTPAPFEYERATSVDGALASLQRLGPGGARHRRRAQPAADDEAQAGEPCAPDRHQRPEGALLHPGRGRRGANRSADSPRRAAEVGAARGAPAALPRRRERDRRPGRPQPRHDRRLALPGGRRRGSLGRLLGGEGKRRHPRGCGRARGRDEGLPRRPVHDRVQRRRAADGDPDSDARRRRQRAREGGAPRRRLGDRGSVGRGLARRRHDRRRGDRAQRRRADDRPRHAGPRSCCGASLHRTSSSRRRARSPPRTAPRAPTAAARSTTSATSRACSRNARCSARPRAPKVRRPR